MNANLRYLDNELAILLTQESCDLLNIFLCNKKIEIGLERQRHFEPDENSINQTMKTNANSEIAYLAPSS